MMERILRTHFSRYPEMQIQDVYKLLHQAAFGSEHAIPNVERAKKWLEREIAEMGKGAEKESIEEISPDGQIVRVHLRPFLAQGGDAETLLSAFLHTANEFEGSATSFSRYWETALALGQFPQQEMETFIAPLREQGYPAVHHSAIFRENYRPAYRVVLAKLLE